MIYLGQIYTIKFSGCKYTFFVYLPYDHTVNKECYPNIKKLVNRIMSMISTTYVCEQAFSSMKNIKSSNRNRLLDSNLNNLMIAATTQYTPNFTSSAGNEQISH